MSRIMDWIDRDNERTDEILASRTTLWLVVRTLLGILFTAKGIALAMHATHVGTTRWRRSYSRAASCSPSRARKQLAARIKMRGHG